ncbi:hypothetical protein [Coxiella burnetii]|uniref:hypothetical protein n=1 Tax=Coxiella burnetii TaxID=777 RepID=UPI0022316604|nr:hypothetical protein [Coxiella burnetii]
MVSQPLSSANCGAIIASAKIHKTDELQQLQTQLQTKIKLFDSLVPNPQSGSDFPIRLIHIGDAKTIADIAKAIYKEGFYASPVSFPVLKQGKAALRIMMRSNLRDEEIIKFCQLLKNFM